MIHYISEVTRPAVPGQSPDYRWGELELEHSRATEVFS